MKRFISAIIAFLMVLSIALPVGAYEYPTEPWIHMYNNQNFLSQMSEAVKWNGKTELKENTYYYTTKTVTVSKNITIPEGTTLEVRKPLQITKGAVLTVCGDLLIDYDGKVNPYSGTLCVSDSGYVHCHGTVAVSKKGVVDVKGQLYVMNSGRLNLKGCISVSENGAAVCAGVVKRYSSAKLTGEIIQSENTTTEIETAFSELSDNDKLLVNFSFYDANTASSVTIDGQNFLDISIEVLENYAIPAYITERIFDGEKGSYKQLKAMLKESTDESLRFLKTNYGSAAGFKRYLSNVFFSSIAPNPAYRDPDALVISDNRYTLSEEYKKLFEQRTALAEKLNQAFFKQLEELGFEGLTIRNTLKNGYGEFCAELSKAQLIGLKSDSRFKFHSVNSGKNIYNGVDKVYISNGNRGYWNASDWEKIKEECGGWVCVVTRGDIAFGGRYASDKTYELVSSYTDIKVSSYGVAYDTALSDISNAGLFKAEYNGLYSFDGFWDQLNNTFRNATKSYLVDELTQYGYFGNSYVYHHVTLSAAEELEALAADENVLLIIEEQGSDE